MPRFYCPLPLAAGASLELPPTAARHVQVLRLQPGEPVTLFNGEGGQWRAHVERMGRSDVVVRVDAFEAVEREVLRRIHLAMGMPANERMDWLIEKAAELGVASLQPLQTAHSVLRLSGERATRKQQHWAAIAASACEQCGGNRVPAVQPVTDFSAWLRESAVIAPLRCVLSLAEGARALNSVLQDHPADTPVLFLSGPEGGLSPQEDQQARAAGFVPVTLGPRVLRAETAALAALVQALN